MKIRTQLLLVVGGVALLPLFGAGWWFYRTSAARLQVQADENLLSYTHRVASETDAFIHFAVGSIRGSAMLPTVVDFIAAAPEARPALRSRVTEVLRDTVVHDPVNISSAVLYDREGGTLLDTATGPRATGAVVAPIVHDSIAAGLPQAMPLFPEDRPPGFWVCAPVRAPEGKVIGALGLWYELSALQSIVAAYSPTPATSIFSAIVDQTGRFLAHAESPELIGRAGPVTRPANGSTGWGQWSRVATAGTPDRIAAVLLTQLPWQVVVVSPAATFGRATRELEQTLAGLGVLVVALSTVAAAIAAARLSRPVTALAAVAERLGRGERGVIMPLAGTGELGTLARTLDAMQRQQAETMHALEEHVAEVRRSEHRLHQLVDAAPVAMILANVRDGTHEFNGMLTKLVGYTASELPDREAWFRVAYPDPVHRRQVEEAWNSYLSAPVPPGEERPPFESTVTCRDGTKRLLEFRASQVGDFLNIACLDLTERRRTEQALRESEEKFSTAFRSTPDAISVSALDDSTFIDINVGFERFFELTRAEVIGRTALELKLWARPADRDRMRDELARSGQVRNFQTVGRTSRGRLKTCLMSVDLTEINGRKCIVAAVHDITEQVAAETARRASAEQVRLLIAHAPEAIVVIDMQTGRFITANPAAEQLFGLSEERLREHNPIDVSPDRQPDGQRSADAASIQLAAVMEGRRPVFEWVHRNAAGRDIECEIRLLRLPDPERVLVRGSIIDLSERKRTERALRTLVEGTAGVTGQAFYNATVAELARSIGVRYAFIGELTRRATHVRSLAASDQGPAPGEEFALDGSPAADVIEHAVLHVEDDLCAHYPRDAALARFHVESFLGFAVRHTTGETVGLVAVLDDKPMPDSEAARLLLAISAARVAAEILRQRASAELELRVAERTVQLAAANAELEAFSYSVSHDLRAPLRIIDGFARALHEDLAGRLDDSSRGHLERIRTGAQRMGALIDDLLRLSRASRVEMRPEPVELAALAGTIVGELRHRHPDRAVEFVCPEALPAVADRALVRILLENLLENAWKYTRKQPAARVLFAAAPDRASANEAAFVVRDNGAGFDMRFVDKLFAPFQRLHPATEFEGTGIGLATVRRIATRHGGRVWAEAAPDAGAAFYFTLSVGAR